MEEHLWGISGPQFLLLYGAALMLALGWVWRVRRGVRRPDPPLPGQQRQQLDVAELAFLAGGPRRVVEAAIARLVESGRLHASRNGQLTAAHTTGSDDHVEAEVLGQVGSAPRSVGAVVRTVAGGPAVTPIGDRLVASRLLVAPAQATSARRRAVLALLAVGAVGLLRLVEGARHGHPVGGLAMLLLLTTLLMLWLYRRRIKARTVHGDRLLASVRRAGVHRSDGLLHPAVALAGVGGAVALGGLMAFPDSTIRHALLLGGAPAVASASGSSGCSSWSYGGDSSSGDGGGGSGGGGGCGGCGCGGGGCGG